MAQDSLDTTGLCLLSLDGGGVRGLSTLYILKGLMTRLNDERKDSQLPHVKPCEIFDLIGGTSTGGLIAIMLGRLEMDIDECIEAYRGLMKTVFEKRRSLLSLRLNGNIKAQFSSKALETAIKQVISSREGVLVNDPFESKVDAEIPQNCKVFVCTVAKETNQITRLKSYRNPGQFSNNPTIWEAALATSAAPTFFDLAQIGVRKYADGALGANNPVCEVEDEASNIWCERTRKLEPLVKCFISIGTGDPGLTPIQDRSWKFLTETVVKIATETKQTAERFTGRWGVERYFRFNVQQGLQSIGLAEYMQEATIDAATCGYLEEHEVKRRVQECVANLRQKKYRPDAAFCIKHVRSQELRAREERQEDRVATLAEISELFDRGNVCLQISRDRINKEDLCNARSDFSHVLHSLILQNPAAKPKEFARVYQKLMSTSLRLSHLPTFAPGVRVNYVREADRYGKLALENAFKSRHGGRVAQMQFYLACVNAREVCLASEVDDLADTVFSGRDKALKAISTTLAELRKMEGLDTAVYETMAREYSYNLTNGL
ncbi:MAG: hypothetical protein M1813_003522 [Trichoglossum hirsutum]|nr:MAG: hypothetical protein M1813_003522 [Trichoglossum hirsutum]